MNKDKKVIIVLAIIIIVLVVGGISFMVGKNYKEKNELLSDVSNTELPEANFQNNEYSTFTNTSYGYSFGYKNNRFINSKNTSLISINDGDCVKSECATLYQVITKEHVADINDLKALMIKDLGSNLSACKSSNPTWIANTKIANKQTIQLDYFPCAGSHEGIQKTELGTIYNNKGYIISFDGMYGGEYKGEMKTEFDNLVNSFKFINAESPVVEGNVVGQPAYLSAIYTKNSKNYIDVDYIQVINGVDSLIAQVEDGKCATIKPGDCYESPGGYKRNQNPKIRTFEVNPTIKINVYGSVGMFLFNNNSNSNPTITFDKFLQTLSTNNIKNDYIMIDVKNNIVTKIVEPYQE